MQEKLSKMAGTIFDHLKKLSKMAGTIFVIFISLIEYTVGFM